MTFFFAEENYDAFCLAYMFTYRDFEGGTLGLAWTGDMKNAGGVCERNGVSFRHTAFNSARIQKKGQILLDSLVVVGCGSCKNCTAL